MSIVETLSGLLVGYLWIVLALAIFMIVCWWLVYEKLGEKGWVSIIPFYNNYVLTRSVWKPMFFWITDVAMPIGLVLGIVMMTVGVFASGGLVAFGTFLTYGCMIAYVVLCYIRIFKMLQKLGFSTGYFIGYLLIPYVFLPIVAFVKPKTN